MKRMILIMIPCLYLLSSAHAQTWDEWTKQKKTQRKYMLQQIAKLQVHLENVRKGYEIVKSGLNIIGRIKRGDLELHQIFFGDLLQVKESILQYSGTPRLLHLYQQLTTESKRWLKVIDDFTLLSANEKLIIHNNAEAQLQQMKDDMQALLHILTNDDLQMSDDERIRRIDQALIVFEQHRQWLYATMRSVHLLHNQRSKNLHDYQHLQKQFKK